MKKIVLIIVGIVVLIIIAVVFLLVNSRVIVFEKTIKTEMQPTEVWSLFQQAFTDSSQVELWPDNEMINSSGLRDGSKVFVTYKVLGNETKLNYTLFDVSIGKGFKYNVGDDHPMLGVGEIQIVPRGDKTEITWKGTFAIQRVTMAGVYAKYFFVENFFDQFEKNFGVK